LLRYCWKMAWQSRCPAKWGFAVRSDAGYRRRGGPSGYRAIGRGKSARISRSRCAARGAIRGNW
jgi:hypothetical protein